MSNESSLYPLLFEPVYKDYIWGGTRIPEVFKRDVPAGIYAESWEISDREEGMSVISNGPLAAKTLADAAATLCSDLLGSQSPGSIFPLLIKLIDSKQCLSVQVHPNNENAEIVGGEPKTEMWHVLAAEPGAQVYCGLKSGVDRSAFIAALEAERLETVLEAVPVAPGDTIFVPGGRVHAIDAGCLLLEVQQNSNTTYRVYDWGRVGHDGNPRELHVEQALQVITWDDDSPAKVAPAGQTLVTCPFFTFDRLDLNEEETISNDGRSFHALFVAGGAAEICGNGVVEDLATGTSCLAPAGLSEYTLKPLDGEALILRATL